MLDRALEADGAFVGALLHLSASAARDALALVEAEDFVDPRLAVVADVCRELADRGIAPDPATVLAHARAGATVTGVEPVRALALLLAELYGTVPVPGSVGYYRLGLLDGALRRRCQVLADRVAQAVEHDTLTSLLNLLVAEVPAVLAVQDRRVRAGAVTA
jgi:hypothetical protein